MKYQNVKPRPLLFIICILAYAPVLNDFPRFFDYDEATLGIYVNDITYWGDYTRSFKESGFYQDRYRVYWAAQKASYSLLFSLLQRLLNVSYFNIEYLMKCCGFLFTFAGTACAAALFARADDRDSDSMWFVIVLSAVHPSLLLNSRTASVFFALTFFLFWAALFLAYQYSLSRQPFYLVLLAPTLTLFALNLYPPIICLLIMIPVIIFTRITAAKAVKDRNLYVGVALFLFLYLSSQYGLAHYLEGNSVLFFSHINEYLAARSHSVSAGNLSEYSFLERLTKYLNQHFLFLHDNIGDSSRNDTPWTMGSPNIFFIMLVPIMISGLRAGLGRLERGSVIAASTIAVFMAFVFTISFPEGRYMLAMIPCYAYLIDRGFRHLIHDADIRRRVVGLALFLVAANSFIDLTTHYDARMKLMWREYDGLREAVPQMHALSESRHSIVTFDLTRRYPNNLYFKMVSGGFSVWKAWDAFFEDAAADTGKIHRFVVLHNDNADYSSLARFCESHNFSPVAELQTSDDRTITLFSRPKSPIDKDE